MAKTWPFAALLVGVAIAVGCGYPVDQEKWLPDFGIHGDHGAIAVSAVEFKGALTARYLNQGEADAKALQLCGAGCEIVLRFEGSGVCGVLASSSNRHFGVGSGDSLDKATGVAMAQCATAGGVGCTVQLDGCND